MSSLFDYDKFKHTFKAAEPVIMKPAKGHRFFTEEELREAAARIPKFKNEAEARKAFPDESQHHLRFICDCGSNVTCRCSAPKTTVRVESCYRCSKTKDDPKK